jgi:uncharacterized membrane protein YphA (DoxX/SURF4 family)
MTLGKLTIGVAIAALLFTFLLYLLQKKQVKNIFISYLQSFTGMLFIFSGAVKAIDPLGTAYKMEQYFAEFESTFQATWMSFIAPLFPTLSEYAIGFSVGMIVFEVILGVMLLVGAFPKFTSWAFFLLVAFFTFLTGFTYLTGYVPSEPVIVAENEAGKRQQFLESAFEEQEKGWIAKDTVKVNFFNFGYWQEYKETNMKVTDCGCFGDFMKLKPFTSFMKDVFLMIPAILFLFFSSQMHQMLSKTASVLMISLGTIGATIYCLSNYVWNLPDVDFRPFKEGVNVVERKAYEAEATAVKVIGYELINKSTKEKVQLGMDQLSEFKNYPKTEWNYEQIRSKPAMEPTKISDFAIENYEGYEITEDILEQKGYSIMIVAYKLDYDGVQTATSMRSDTTFAIDTLKVENNIKLVQRVVAVKEIPVENHQYVWNDNYVKRWTAVVNPLIVAAEKAGIKAYAVTKPYSYSVVDDFRHATQSAYPFYKADDILLKTIIRSNPGIVLWKDGAIVKKWHYKQLPSFESIKQWITE